MIHNSGECLSWAIGWAECARSAGCGGWGASARRRNAARPDRRNPGLTDGERPRTRPPGGTEPARRVSVYLHVQVRFTWYPSFVTEGPGRESWVSADPVPQEQEP